MAAEMEVGQTTPSAAVSLETPATPHLPKNHSENMQHASPSSISSPLRISQVVGDTAKPGTALVPGFPGVVPDLVQSAPSADGFALETVARVFAPESTHRTVDEPTGPEILGKEQHKRQASTALGPRSEDSTHSQNATPGASAPPGRRSVQFARLEDQPELDGINERERVGSDDHGFGEGANKGSRGGSLFSKLRALANPTTTSGPTRNPGGRSVGADLIDERFEAFSPVSEAQSTPVADSPQGYDSEADGEDDDSGAEQAEDHVARRRRKSRRPQDGGPQTAPASPKTPFMREVRTSYFSSGSQQQRQPRPSMLPRRATETDLVVREQTGVSEDEGRNRIARSTPFRRVHGFRALSYNNRRMFNHSSSEQGRPSPFRRGITSLAAPSPSAEGIPPSPWKLRRDHTAQLSAVKWRQIKASIKMLGRQRRAETIIDHAKSAELLAELTAGVPAALIIASMFQRDEKGNKRVPILLEQLKVKITDSQQIVGRSGDRHLKFRIELEYGNGPTRMKWFIERTLRDFYNLHAKYKFLVGAQKYIQLRGDDARAKLPHFPTTAIPYLRGARGGADAGIDVDENMDRDLTGPSENEGNGNARPQKKRRSSLGGIMRRRSSMAAEPLDGDHAHISQARRETWPERSRRKLEVYLQQMIRYLIFRPESNRLCKFLELSSLGVRLAAEGSYHGKEGTLIIQSGKGVDFRRALKPQYVRRRHGPKWFLVRHSYVVCVDSAEEMNIYDVFLVDSDFRIATKKRGLGHREPNPKGTAKSAKKSAAPPKLHSLKLYNSERKMRLLAKNERQLQQFEASITSMAENTPWIKTNRFDSFAPVRPNVFAQWLVDGRDYMWNVSRAISMAKDVIYIHDWWLSPELYMRRPAAISNKWRLDRLLQRKAREGVKIFIIMYRNINSAVPIDSEHSKLSLLDLDPNVFVQRSPNQIRQGTFFWAHHEKICVVDHMIAFVGGIDLCFGRWDTPQHPLADDKLTGFEDSDMPKDADHCQLWPGKDYSNPRVQDFYALEKPYEEIYDRSKVPRMPWHDISMQIVGQPARDLVRHFVQRWNYILRQRIPSRPTPFLLPPPDFAPADLEALGLKGTCEVQILRSCGMWSMGTPNRTERSILNAYVKMIQHSDHFVYVENQFFVTSCEVEGTKVENSIGDALVERIIRAEQNGESWRAIILIPLMPGFQNTVDAQDGTSVRVIMQCQFRSISRGEGSIFSRLRAVGIDPEDYIQFYSLRSWGKIGPSRHLVTEQLYIHAKCMIVDDRIAIIASANINERSMLGNRDSECGAVVRDTDMIWSTMHGEPYLVGKFAHTLRMRLMREHLGIDVDACMEAEEDAAEEDQWAREMDAFHGEEANPPVSNNSNEAKTEVKHPGAQIETDAVPRHDSMSHDTDREQANNIDSKTKEIANQARERKPTISSESRSLHLDQPIKGLIDDTKSISAIPLPPSTLPRMTTHELGLPMLSQLPPLPKTDDKDIGGPCVGRVFSSKAAGKINPLLSGMRRPEVTEDCMKDPLNDSFYNEIWHTVAENNTLLFRSVFRCMPDNEVKTWKEYKGYAAYYERFSQAHSGGKSQDRMQQERPGVSGPPGAASTSDKLRMLSQLGKGKAGVGQKAKGRLRGIDSEKSHPLGNIGDWADEADRESRAKHSVETNHNDVGHREGESAGEKGLFPSNSNASRGSPTKSYTGDGGAPQSPVGINNDGSAASSGKKKKRRNTPKSAKHDFKASDDIISNADAEELLNMVQGSLVIFPCDWLAKEDQGGNWMYSIDQLAPLEIYN